MTVALLLISDGRDDYLRQARASLDAMLPAPDVTIHVDDCNHELGFDGAIAEGWRQVIDSGADWVWHAEQDFTYNEPVALDAMIATLQRQPQLTQLSLLRQPVSREEIDAGGIVQLAPDEYTEASDEHATWTEVQRYVFTTNPSVYSAALCHYGWPRQPRSEAAFGDVVRGIRPDCRCGIWGAKWDAPRVTHIGDRRTGKGY